MKKYIVIGHYSGKVLLQTDANDLSTALKKFTNAEEDDIEILEPNKVQYEEENVMIKKDAPRH